MNNDINQEHIEMTDMFFIRNIPILDLVGEKEGVRQSEKIRYRFKSSFWKTIFSCCSPPNIIDSIAVNCITYNPLYFETNNNDTIIQLSTDNHPIPIYGLECTVIVNDDQEYEFMCSQNGNDIRSKIPQEYIALINFLELFYVLLRSNMKYKKIDDSIISSQFRAG